MNETNEEMDTYFEIKPVEHKEEEKSESSKSIKIEDDDYSDDPSKRKKGKKGSYEKKHKCNQCVYATHKKDHLAVHMRIHSGEKLHKCDQCDFASAQKSNLVVHKKIHNPEKPFKCDVEGCEYGAYQKDHLNRHKVSHQEGRTSRINNNFSRKQYSANNYDPNSTILSQITNKDGLGVTVFTHDTLLTSKFMQDFEINQKKDSAYFVKQNQDSILSVDLPKSTMGNTGDNNITSSLPSFPPTIQFNSNTGLLSASSTPKSTALSLVELPTIDNHESVYIPIPTENAQKNVGNDDAELLQDAELVMMTRR